MNKHDKNRVAGIVEHIEDLEAQLKSCGEELRELADAETEKFENLPGSLRQSESGQAIEHAASVLSEAANEIDAFSISYNLLELEEIS